MFNLTVAEKARIHKVFRRLSENKTKLNTFIWFWKQRQRYLSQSQWKDNPNVEDEIRGILNDPESAVYWDMLLSRYVLS